MPTPFLTRNRQRQRKLNKTRRALQGQGKTTKEETLKKPVFLQTGSFQSAADADNQKAKLALMGAEAEVQQVMLQDKVWYRVRLGPFKKMDEASTTCGPELKQGRRQCRQKGLRRRLTKLMSHWLAAIACSLLAFAMPAHAQTPLYRRPRLRDDRAGTADPKCQQEVVEYFSYACPHCNELNTHIIKWESKLPADVVSRAYRLISTLSTCSWRGSITRSKR